MHNWIGWGEIIYVIVCMYVYKNLQLKIQPTWCLPCTVHLERICRGDYSVWKVPKNSWYFIHWNTRAKKKKLLKKWSNWHFKSHKTTVVSRTAPPDVPPSFNLALRYECWDTFWINGGAHDNFLSWFGFLSLNDVALNKDCDGFDETSFVFYWTLSSSFKR